MDFPSFTRFDSRWDIPVDIWWEIMLLVATTHPESALMLACSAPFFRHLLRRVDARHHIKKRMSLARIFKKLPVLSSRGLRSISRLMIEHGNLDAYMLMGTRECWFNGRPLRGLILLNRVARRGHPQAIYNANVVYRLFRLDRLPSRIIPSRSMYSFTKFGKNRPVLTKCRRNLLSMLNFDAINLVRDDGWYTTCQVMGEGHRPVWYEQDTEHAYTCDECIRSVEIFEIRDPLKKDRIRTW